MRSLHRPTLRRVWPALGVGLALTLTACSGGEAGLEVSRCEPWGAAARAGIATGDALLAWQVGEERGILTSPLELFALEIEHGAAASVGLTAVRGGHERTVRLDGAPWALETRPASAAGPWKSQSTPAARTPGRLRDEAARARADGAPLLAAWWKLAEGDLLAGSGEVEGAAAAYAGARDLAADPRHRAAVDDWQARRWLAVKHPAEALTAQRRALALREAIGPDSAAVAVSLHQLGRIAYRSQRYDDDGSLERAAAILARLPQGGELRAAVLSLRGSMAWGRRDLDAAEGWYRAAVALLAATGRESPERANLLGNLGLVAELRGEMGRAEELFHGAAAMHRRVDPESVDAAYSYNYLGILAKQKGDLETARRHYERATAIFEVERPDSVETAGMLSNLGNLALLGGELTAAERLYRRALAVREQVVPETLDHAASLQHVGRVLHEQGKAGDAEPYLLRARAIKQRLAPGSLDYANALTALGTLRRDQGRLSEAEVLHHEALAVRRATADGRWEWAESLFLLGEIAFARGQPREAERRWREAVEGVESNRERAEWDPHERAAFAAPFHRFYRRLAALLAADGRSREAFELLEDARSRALRGLLAGRRLRQQSALPAARLARRAALAEPRRRNLDEVAAALGAGQVLLAYSVAEDATLLFVLPAGAVRSLAVYQLPVGAAELGSRVTIFRALIERGGQSGAVEPALLAQGRWLFDRLLLPAAEALDAAEEIVIVPDGPLLDLPFAALVPSDRTDVAWVAEWRPLSFVPAAGVLVELAEAAQPRPARGPLVAFGDPRPGLGPRNWGRSLAPLPASRIELDRIAAVYRESHLYLGTDATEERLGALPVSPAILHLAVHGLLDERFPMESALALSPSPAEDANVADGLLHAWEVAERLDLDADLVVLSACDSGRGRALAGEGVLGLAHAFQIAGARSVLATQWPVADHSTAELMARFYRQLAAGRPKAAALAAAQRELSRGSGPATHHPFAWAGFQIVGHGR